MPYIKNDRRLVIRNWLTGAWASAEGASDLPALRADAAPQDCGELNFALTMTVIEHNQMKYGGLDARLEFIVRDYLFRGPMRYQRINDVIGALHCATMELDRRRPGAKKFEAITLNYLARSIYTRVAVAYELTKIAENGDIDYGESADATAIRDQAKDRVK